MRINFHTLMLEILTTATAKAKLNLKIEFIKVYHLVTSNKLYVLNISNFYKRNWQTSFNKIQKKHKLKQFKALKALNLKK